MSMAIVYNPQPKEAFEELLRKQLSFELAYNALESAKDTVAGLKTRIPKDKVWIVDGKAYKYDPGYSSPCICLGEVAK
jgi:hypothetical protein